MGIFLSKKMKYFMVIMEKRNFGQAADDLCITRSPLSKVISEIEIWIGGKLFIRKHNELEPTKLAWEYYHKCKPIYHKLLNLEDECSNKKPAIPLVFHFDISVPEIMFRQLKMVALAEKIDAQFTRELVDINSECHLKYQRNHVIISFRALSCGSLIEQSIREGSSPVLISSTSHRQSETLNNIYIWRDKYTDYMKERYSLILNNLDIQPHFIEHNYDILTLLHAVRTGKGSILMTNKLSQIFNLKDTESRIIKGYTPRIYLYANLEDSRKNTLGQFKKLIPLFL